MPLDFPANPSPNDTYTFGSKTWIWNGEYWRLQSAGAINNIPIGNVTANTGNFTTLAVQTGVVGDLAPATTVTSDLGTDLYRWRDLYLSNSTIYIGNGTISANETSLILTNPDGSPFEGGGNGTPGGLNTQIQFNDSGVFGGSAGFTFDKATNAVSTSGSVTATGNVTGGNILTAGLVNATGNVTGGNLTTAGTVTGTDIAATGTVTSTGNVSGGNITTAGAVSSATVTATGNVTGGNISTEGTVTATGNVSGGNITTLGTVNGTDLAATANVSAGNVSATGNIAGANVTATGNIDGANVSATGNVSGGNLVAASNVVAAGAVFSGNVSASNFIGDITGNITGNISAGGANTEIQFNDDGVINGSSAFTFDSTSNAVTVTGNITAANFTTGGTVTATGDVSGSNIVTAGRVEATGNVSGGNVVATAGITAGTTVNATGNVSGGNITTAGAVEATGNVSAGNVITTGNIDGANVTASGLVSAADVTATGDVTGGNIITAGNVAANTVSATSTLTLASTGNVVFASGGNIVDMGGSPVINVGYPSSSSSAATKQYVDDSVSSGITIHDPVQLLACTFCVGNNYTQGGTTATVTDTVAGNTVVFSSAIDPQVNDQLWFTNSFNGVVGNVPYFVVSAPNTSAAVLSTTYGGDPVANITTGGSLTEPVRINSGQGATITNAGANVRLTIDSTLVTTGNRVILTAQTNPAQNGVYDVTEQGAPDSPGPGAQWVLTRSSDMDTYIPNDIDGLDAGDYFYVQDGVLNKGESWVLTAPTGPVIIGYANLTFTQFSASQVYSANTQAGIDLNGTVFSAKVDDNTTAFDGGGNIIVKAGANLVTPNIGAATGTSLTVTGNVLAGNLESNAAVTGVTVTASGNIDGANVNAGSGITAGTTVIATGNVSGGNLTTAGALAAASADVIGNITAGNLLTDGYYYANGQPFSGGGGGGGGVPGGSNTQIQFNDSGGFGGSAAFTFDKATNAVSITGNVSASNVNTTGTVSATGNVSGGNLIAVANVVAAGGSFTNKVTAQDFVTPVSVISSNTSAVSGTLYVFTDTLTLTLPAGPAVGDSVFVSNRSNQTDCLINRNSSNIMGASEDLQVNVLNVSFELVYVNPSQGWILL